MLLYQPLPGLRHFSIPIASSESPELFDLKICIDIEKNPDQKDGQLTPSEYVYFT